MTKKGKIVLFSIIGALTLGVAAGVTVFLINNVFTNPPKEDVPKTIEEYEVNYADVNETFSSIKKSKSIEDIFTTYKPHEIVNFSLSDLKVNVSNYKIHTYGTSKAAIATQSISNVFSKNNDKYYQHSISTGLINTAKCFTMENNIVSIFNGEIIDSETADFSGEPIETLSSKEFKDSWGIDYSFPTIYIISKETVLKESIEKKDSSYIINLELDPNISTLKYVKQQRKMGDLEADPVFKEVKLTYQINNEYKIEKVSTHEYSVVKRFLWVENTTDIVDTYQYN